MCRLNAAAMQWRPSIRPAAISNISTNQSKASGVREGGGHDTLLCQGGGRLVESLIMLDVAFKGQGTAVLKKMSITAFESMLLFVEVMLGVEGFQSHCKHLQSVRNQPTGVSMVGRLIGHMWFLSDVACALV